MSQSQKPLTAESFNQLSEGELVRMLLTQQKVIEKLQQEIEKLKSIRDVDSKTSSKPPSTDLLKKSEKAKNSEDSLSSDQEKRLPGGQPGHQGKTHKGFSRIDRIKIFKPSRCSHCDQTEFLDQPVAVETQQVAQLVARPIALFCHSPKSFIISEF